MSVLLAIVLQELGVVQPGGRKRRRSYPSDLEKVEGCRSLVLKSTRQDCSLII